MAALAPVALLVQQMAAQDQVLVLGRIAEGRGQDGRFPPAGVDAIYDELALPRPAKVANVLLRLERDGLVGRHRTTRGSWRLTPLGRQRSQELVADVDMAGLVAEAKAVGAPLFGSLTHPLISPAMAPPELLGPLREFLAKHPFDLNVFGMTRFPDSQDENDPDPVAGALDTAREVCASHGLEFHLASDRAMADDLWTNVTAHMWASRYGIAFFEDRRGRRMNYNLTVEVGGMLVTGRRTAIIKDKSIDQLPTDLVSKIYKPVDLDDLTSVADALHGWLRDDLGFGSCPGCATK